MKSYEARLMFLQFVQRRYEVPTSDEPGQVVPEIEEAEAFVLAQRAELDRKAPKAAQPGLRPALGKILALPAAFSGAAFSRRR